MRKYLLAGAALAVATAALPAVSMAADMPATVTIGGRVFESLFIQNVTNQNPGPTTYQSYNMQDYFRLYPAVDYTAPNGIHYGFKAELRWAGGQSGAGHIDRAFLFVKSDRMGKLTIGGQDGALEDAAVANDEASGTGGWDGEYGFFGGGYQWLMADTVANGNDGIKYVTPSFGGLSVIASFIPDSTSGLGTDKLIKDAPAGSGNGVKNRIEGAITYSGSFGATGISADIGAASGAPEAVSGYQNLSVIDAGVQVTFGGLAIGAQVDSGKYANGFGAQLSGLGDTTAYDAGVLYSFGAAQVGAQYYGYKTPVSATVTEKFSGGALGAKYTLNPGVTLFFDALVGSKTDTNAPKTNFTGVGVGTYFQW